MTQMIRASAKAFSVFDAAKLVLTSGDRFAVKFALAAGATSRLHTVPADGSLWLSRDEAVAHLLQSDVLQQYYKSEQIELEEPKGNFTSVAVCGMSGEILGPPNHHSYQTALHRVHREKFAHLPFEDFKRRVRTESTPEAVEQWKESQKHGTQWIDLKAEVPEGAEPPRFKTRTEMETHFRNHYASQLIGEATEATVAGNIPRKHLAAALFNVLRHAVEEARKHLLPLAQRLCASFEQHGLKLFKRRGGKLWVSRTRPRLLDSHIALSARIAKIMGIIKDKPGIPVKELLAILAPHLEAEKAAAIATAAPAPAAPAPVEEAAPPAAAETTAGTESESEPESETAETTATPVSEKAPVETPPASAVTPEEEHDRVEVLKDLHWLNSEGYIIEYSDGVVFPGVTEPPPAKPKPVKEAPAKKPAAEVEAAPAAEMPATETEAAASEAAPQAGEAESAPEPYHEAFEESEAEIMVKEEAAPVAEETPVAEVATSEAVVSETPEASEPAVVEEAAQSEHARHQD